MSRLPLFEFVKPSSGVANPGRIKVSKTIKLFESLIWYVLLVLIVLVSFLVEGYASRQWLFFSACFYTWLCVSLLVLACGGRFSLGAASAAKHVIVLLVTSLLWLSLSLNINYEHALYQALGGGLSDNTPAWFTPTTLWTVTPERTRWLLMSELLFFCLFVSTLVLLNSRRRLKTLLLTFILIGALHAVIGLFGKSAGFLFVEASQVDGHFTVARGVFVNRNHFAAFLILTLMGALAFEWRLLKQYQHGDAWGLVKQHLVGPYIFLLLAILLALIACANSESRGAVLSFLAAIGITIFLARQRIFMANGAALTLLVALALFAGLLYFGQDLISRFGRDALSLGERSEQWVITLRAIRENPIFGYGGGSYATVFQMFRDQDGLRQVLYAQSHNHYLHLWLERGLVGLGLWLAAFALCMRSALRSLRATRSTLVSGALIGALVVFLAALIQSFVDFNLQMLNIRAYFYVVLAVIFAAPLVNGKRS